MTVSAFLFMGNALLFTVPTLTPPQPQLVATRSMSLDNRAMPGSLMSEVMEDNILLTIAYMRRIVPNRAQVDWEAVRKPFTYSFELKPGETYAFQKDVLPEYAGSVAKTIDVNFGYADGYKNDGYLVGDGVCHLASLFYWAAKDAGLNALAPTNHNFMAIPEIPREYGVAIYSQPGSAEANAQQNLYVKNDTSEVVTFEISYDGDKLTTKVLKEQPVKNVGILSEEII